MPGKLVSLNAPSNIGGQWEEKFPSITLLASASKNARFTLVVRMQEKDAPYIGGQGQKGYLPFIGNQKEERCSLS